MSGAFQHCCHSHYSILSTSTCKHFRELHQRSYLARRCSTPYKLRELTKNSPVPTSPLFLLALRIVNDSHEHTYPVSSQGWLHS